MTKSLKPPSSVNRLENGNIEIILILPWPDIQKAYQSASDEAVLEAQLPGFRKGKAPRHLVEPKLDKTHLYSHAVEHLLPPAYAAAVKVHSLKPILNPKITIRQATPNLDWTFTALVCEAPAVTLPSPLKPPPDPKNLADYISVKVPDLLVEEEANHRLSALAENLSQLGLTVEKYLTTKKISREDLLASTSQTARADLANEFILETIRTSQVLPDRKSTLDFIKSLV